jgi:hypothetical protein
MRLALIFLLAAALHAQTYFTASSGSVTCRVTPRASTTVAFSYLCFEPGGATAGSYTAAATTTVDVVPIGLTIGLPVGLSVPAGSVTCMIAVNSTLAAVVVGSFGSVPASSFSWQCAGSQSGNSGPVNLMLAKQKGKK